MIGWYIGILGIFIGIIGGICFLLSYLLIEKQFKSNFFYLVVASFIYVIFSTIMIVLALQQNVDFESYAWQIIPILFTISTVFFVIGSTRLVGALNSIRSASQE